MCVSVSNSVLLVNPLGMLSCQLNTLGFRILYVAWILFVWILVSLITTISVENINYVISLADILNQSGEWVCQQTMHSNKCLIPIPV